MEKVIKTQDALAVYNIMMDAHYSKLENQDKVLVWKITRKLAPIAKKFEEDRQDAICKFRPGDDFQERMQKARQYEADMKDGVVSSSMKAEYEKFIKEYQDYNELVNNAIQEFADKEVTLEFQPLSEEAFARLLESNEWTIGQMTVVGDFVCE